MTDKELKILKNEYERFRNYCKEIEKIEETLEIYKQNPIVNKYIELCSTYESYKQNDKYEIFNKSNEDYMSYMVKTFLHTNNPTNIYVYIDDFSETICGINSSKKKREYKIYRNLELNNNQRGYEIYVPFKECKDFEEDNIVIYPNHSISSEDFYFELKNIYFETAIKNNRQEAIKKVLILNDSKDKR